ncbi:hypothetical protein QVD17_10149 [Tagetes erecta]|uniref:non-specific serine/threonine protein kinase n=1 Tax=Tagetes erecta TaxID=13708 RepID=A0AAD8L8Q4_TARER|nr:hypothetical protein QVD17_10149 [Tagetes erecta]
MNLHNFIPKLLIFIIVQVHRTNSEGFYGTCNTPFSCGTVSGFQYPFRRHQDPTQCGYPGFELNCDDPNPPTINIMNITYRILAVNPTNQIMTLVRGDMVNSTCPLDLVNTTIDHNLFDYTSSYTNITFLYGCPVAFNPIGMIGSLACGSDGTGLVILAPGALGPGMCKASVIIPSLDSIGFMDPMKLVQVLQDGFDVRWKVESRPCADCTGSGGQCVYSTSTRLTKCACPETSLLGDSCSKLNKTEVSLSPSSSSSPGINFLP